MAEADAVAALPLGELSLQALHNSIRETTADLEACKSWLGQLNAEVSARLGSSAKAAFEQAGKEHGTLTLPLQGGLAAKVEIGKRVEWDSGKLLAIAQSMPWERVNQIFKIAFSVSETTYKGIAAVDATLKAQIDEARTVKLGEPKITLGAMA